MSTSHPLKFPAADYPPDRALRCRTIIAAPAAGWSEIAMYEWELTAESWTDKHPHSEYTFVIEGQLFIDCAGTTIEASKGDAVLIPPHHVARYWTRSHARLLAIYGPNDGLGTTERLGHEKLAMGP